GARWGTRPPVPPPRLRGLPPARARRHRPGAAAPPAAAPGPAADPALPLAQPGDAVAVLPRRRRRAGARREAPDARRLEGRARHPLQVRRDRGPTGPAPARRSTALGRERRRAVDVLVPERVRRARPRPIVRAQGPRPLPRGAARPAPPALSRGPGAGAAPSAPPHARPDA